MGISINVECLVTSCLKKYLYVLGRKDEWKESHDDSNSSGVKDNMITSEPTVCQRENLVNER